MTYRALVLRWQENVCSKLMLAVDLFGMAEIGSRRAESLIVSSIQLKKNFELVAYVY